MGKSHVTIETKICLVTGKEYDSGTILLHKRLLEKFDPKTITGWGLSPEVSEKIAEGYAVMVGMDPEKSGITKDATRITNPASVYRTGEVAYIRRELAVELFNIPVEDVNFVDPGVIKLLKEMNEKAQNGNTDSE